VTIQHVIEVQQEVSLPETVDLKFLRVAALATLKQQQIEEKVELTLVLTDDDSLQALNRRFRGVDRPTDVLSFANETRGPFAGGATGRPQYLGDIVISLPTAMQQSEEAGCTLTEELQLLIVHGTLHLLGYDHESPMDKTEMWAVQARLLELLDIEAPLPE
jgi:probable rRNA maturation factor